MFRGSGPWTALCPLPSPPPICVAGPAGLAASSAAGPLSTVLVLPQGRPPPQPVHGMLTCPLTQVWDGRRQGVLRCCRSILHVTPPDSWASPAPGCPHSTLPVAAGFRTRVAVGGAGGSWQGSGQDLGGGAPPAESADCANCAHGSVWRLKGFHVKVLFALIPSALCLARGELKLRCLCRGPGDSSARVGFADAT